MGENKRDDARAATARWFRATMQAAAVWTTVGLFRGLVNLSFDGANGVPARLSMSTAILVTWFWVPVTLLALKVWRTHWPRWSRPRRSATVLGGAAAVALLQPVWAAAVARLLGQRGSPYLAFFAYCLDVNCLFYLACLAFLWGAWALDASEEAARAAADLELRMAETELHVATMQLHPHFLFNALHLISERALESPVRAQQLVWQLRSLLEQSFKHAPDGVVPLREELSFLHSYLKIQKERFGARIDVTIDVAPDAMEIDVPHLLLQPLVENAIRHGVGRRASGGHVWIRARRDGERVTIEVEDDGVGVAAGMPVRDGLGTGATRRRLQLVFGDASSLSLQARDGGGTVARAVFPAHSALARRRAAHAEPRWVRDLTGFEREGLVERWLSLARHNTTAATLLTGGGLTVLWIAMSAIWTATDILGGRSLNIATAVWPTFLRFAVIALVWALAIIPLGVVLSRLVSARARTRRTAAIGHAAAAAALTFVQISVAASLGSLLHAGTDVILRWAPACAVWVVSTYATIAILGRSARLAIDAHARRVAMLRLDAAAAVADARLKQLQLQPGVMLAALGHAGTIVRAGGPGMEHAIARLGDLLRSISRGSSAGGEGWRLADELSAVRAYGDLLDASGESAPFLIEVDAAQRALGLAVPAAVLTPLVVALARECGSNSTGSRLCHISADAPAEGSALFVTVRVDASNARAVAHDIAATLRGLEELLSLQAGGRDTIKMSVQRESILRVQLRLARREFNASHAVAAGHALWSVAAA